MFLKNYICLFILDRHSKDVETTPRQWGLQFPTTYKEGAIRADSNWTHIYSRGNGHEGFTVPE